MLLESHRYSLIHFEVLVQAVRHAVVLQIGDLASREVLNAVVEANLGDLVVLLDELFDLKEKR